MRAAGDSLLLRLRRLGYEGTLTLGAAGDGRAGVMRSRPLEGQLSELVVTGASPEASSAARQRRAAPAQAAKAAPPAAAANEARTAAPAIPIVARRIRCPG
jgi:aromatic ring hydroxylase